jgi:hypothetical protein
LKKLGVSLVLAACLVLAGAVSSAKAAHRSSIVPFGPAPTAPFVLCGPGCGGGDGVDCNNNYDSTVPAYRNYSGYYKETVPSVGSSISANIEMVSSHITSTGLATAAWTGVDGSGGWIQAGIADYPSGPQLYIEWNNGVEHYTNEGAASFGTNYSVVITHTASNTWQATVGGAGPVSTSSIGSPSETQTQTESQDQVPGTSCNAVDAIFTTMSPARNTMHVDDHMAPDYVENVGAATFEGVQLQYGS